MAAPWTLVDGRPSSPGPPCHEPHRDSWRVDIGVGQWLRLVIGLLEVAGGVGLLVPRVRALAALCLLVLLLGATVTNVTVLATGPLVSLVLAVVALAILLLRRRELLAKTGP